MRRLGIASLLVLCAVPLFELGAHAKIVGGVAPDRDFAKAAAFVRAQFRARDLIVAAPAYVDPIVRLHAGDMITLAMAGRSDDAAFERKWVIALAGADPGMSDKRPELTRDFGRVRVLRYALGRSPVLYDFVESLASAQVSLGARPCPYREGGVPRGGGLGRGVLYPLAQSFVCDARRPWLFVGSVVMEDLTLRPRRCIWQHAAGNEPVVATWNDVPLGDELVLYGGIYYEHERMREGGVVRADVLIDGERRATLQHHDGDGFLRLRVPTGGAARGQVRIEVRAEHPDKRSFCWAASTRSAARAGATP